MKIRCDLHISNKLHKLYLVSRPEEKDDHLAMKLAGAVMFHDRSPIVDPSPDHPSLFGFAHRPDICVLDEGGQLIMWIECGTVSLHKLNKVLRKMAQGRVVVIKPDKREAEKLRNDISGEVRNSERVEIWCWADGDFEVWLKAIREKTEIFGDADERNFNVVVNETPYAAHLLSV